MSEESSEILRRLAPSCDFRFIPNCIDPDLFRPASQRTPGIAWIPRKRPREASLLARLLRNDPRAAGLELHEIVDRPLADVAQILGRVTVFVSLSHNEGFGLPAAEALAAGAHVVGYDGGGGRALFDAPGADAIPDQRPLLLADRALELACCPPDYALANANRDWILARHAPKHTAQELTAAVTAALDRPGADCTASHPYRWFDELDVNFAVSG